ncbi:MAG TPA: hypothetical protein VIJ95_04270 [Hanamia sp.]
MKKLFVLSVISLVIFSSCKKEITQQVNQAYSAVYNIAPTDWTTNNGGLSYTASLQIPELDNSIYLGGGVLVYISFSGTGYYEALPEVFEGFTYGAIHSNGYVSIDISDLSGNIMNPPTQSISAKVILIDAQSLDLHRDVNLNDLRAVQKAFNVN